jgi:hypothetical protein
MKLTFSDNSYIEVVKTVGDIVMITIAAKDTSNKLIVHTVELSLQQFQALVKLT